MQNKSKQANERKKPSSITLMDKRVLFLEGEITTMNVGNLIKNLFRLDYYSHSEITLYIDSPGGSVHAGLALFDVMNHIKSDIRTICTGMCASMASIILLNGTQGKRCALPNSEVMLHEVSSFAYGKYSELEGDLEHTKKLNNRLIRIIAEKTGKKTTTIKKDIKNCDKWFTASEAKKYGLIDEILEED